MLAYHDRSDGGLLVTLLEMAFAGHCGWSIDLVNLGEDALSYSSLTRKPGLFCRWRPRSARS